LTPMNKKHYSILIADDHGILRAGLRSLVSEETDLEVICEVDNGKDALLRTVELKPDLVLTDLSMPGTNGTEAIRNIKQRLPETKILVITVHKAEEYVHTALKAGADGYILKDDTHAELINAIRNIFAGKTYLSPAITGNVIKGYIGNDKQDDLKPSWDILTHREREVIKLVAEGYRNKDIADYLSISLKTVEKHRSNLMKKLDLHTTSSLTSYAIENGLTKS
jgi:two-component system response regulator NreC